MNIRELKFLTVAAVVALGLGLAGCGGGSSGGDTAAVEPPVVEPDPIDAERTAIAAAIAAAGTAAGMVTDAATDEQVMAANEAVAAAMAAINGATLISAGDAAAYRASLATISGDLTAALDSRTMTMNLASQRMAISEAITAAMTAVNAVMDDSDDATVTAAETAIAAATAAIEAADDISASEARAEEAKVAELQSDLDAAKSSRQTAMNEAERLRMAAEARETARVDAETAIAAAMEAVGALSESSTDEEVTAAQGLIDAAKTAAGNAALDMTQMDGFNTRIAAIEGDFGTVGAARRVIEMAKTAAQTAATEADSAADAAEAAASAQEANKAHDESSYALAKNAAERARTASDAAAAANTAAQAATTRSEAEAQRDIAQRHQATAEAEEANAMRYAGMVATAKSEADDAETVAKAKADSNKVAGTKKTAITTEAGAAAAVLIRPFDGTDRTDPAVAPTANENYVVTVEHKDGAVEVTVADGALPADNDPPFEQTETFGDGQQLVRDIGTERQIIVLHSDIEAPEQKAFSSVYSFTVDRDTDTTAMDTYAVLAADNGKIASSKFPSGEDLEKTYVEYDKDTAAGRASQFSGTFDGASGMYRCVATGGCTVSTDDKGKFEELTAAEWEFTPAAGATVPVADADYMTYGFWLDTTTKDGAIASYDAVQTFATSSLTASTSLGSVTGTATYEGGAAGVYHHETKKEDGSQDTATSGRFTADVALTAYFTGDPLRTDGTIQGTISDFDLVGGPENSWNVKVSATGIATSDDGFTGSASGMTGDNGSLSGRFHGAGDEATDAPPVLIGEFNSTFVNGSVAGAFGARTED